MGRKNVIQKGRQRRRKLKLSSKQRKADDRFMACGRKRMYISEAEAREVATKLGHTVYACSYCKRYHTAHLPGSQRFARGATV